MIIEHIDKLYESGELFPLIKCGVVPPQILMYRKIYHAHEQRIQAGQKKLQAKEDVSLMFKVSQRTIYRVVRFMQQEVE